MVELMVAMIILVVVASSLGVTIISSNDLSRHSRETRLADMELARVMEEVTAVSQGNIPTTFPAGTPIPQNSVLQGLTVTPTYPGVAAGATVPAFLPITLSATWSAADGSQRTLTLTSGKGS